MIRIMLIRPDGSERDITMWAVFVLVLWATPLCFAWVLR